MSSWGRCQESLFYVLTDHEIDSAGTVEPGLLSDLPFERVATMIEPVIESIYWIAFEAGKSQQRYNDSTIPKLPPYPTLIPRPLERTTEDEI